MYVYIYIYYIWLVVWNIFPYTVLGIIIPIDFHIFQRGRSTTSQIYTYNYIYMCVICICVCNMNYIYIFMYVQCIYVYIIRIYIYIYHIYIRFFQTGSTFEEGSMQISTVHKKWRLGRDAPNP